MYIRRIILIGTSNFESIFSRVYIVFLKVFSEINEVSQEYPKRLVLILFLKHLLKNRDLGPGVAEYYCIINMKFRKVSIAFFAFFIFHKFSLASLPRPSAGVVFVQTPFFFPNFLALPEIVY